MNDTFGVGGIKGVGDLDGEREDQVRVHRTIPDAVLQRHAIEEFHHDERLTVLLTDVVDSTDIRMVQRRGSLCLPLKPGERLMIAGDILRQELERHKAMKACVLRFVNHTHSASAELLDDAIVGDGLVDHEWRKDSGCNSTDHKTEKSTA